MAAMLATAVTLSLLPSVLAFRNTSPFFFFSTAELNISSDVDVATSSRLSSQVLEMLQSCPSTTYFVVRQEGVSSAAYADTLAAPRLAHYLSGTHDDVRSTMAVSDVIQDGDADRIAANLQARCGAELIQVHGMEEKIPTISSRVSDSRPLVIELTLPAPSSARRSAVLQEHDAFLDQLVRNAADSREYTVIYTTTASPELNTADAAAPHQHPYEMEDVFGEAVHMELKRDTVAHGHKRAPNQTKGGLFEKYQYLTPGLFMGLSAAVPLLLILFVGLRALASLEVSYFAFSKEMGPAAQKKQ